MSDTYTTFLQEPEPLDREQSIESYIKSRLQSLDKAVAGYTSVSLAGLSGNVDLTPTQAKHRIIVLTGAPSGAVTVRIPAATGANADPAFVNTCSGGSATVTIKSTGANTGNASGVSLPTGYTQHVRHDGESAYPVGQLVTTSGQVPTARVYHNATQAIANATLTALAFNSERWDNAAIHDTATNNSRLTAPVAGKYLIFCDLSWASNATGYRQALIKLNGSTYIAIDPKNAISGDSTKHAVATVYELAAGDYVEVVGYQTSGGALNVDNTAAFSCEFGMMYLGR